MNDNRKTFLEHQINLHHKLIDEMEDSRLNREQRQGLQNLKVMYKQYVAEYKEIYIHE